MSKRGLNAAFAAFTLFSPVLHGEHLVIHLEPQTQIDLATRVPEAYKQGPITHAFLVRPTGLYFLISPPAATPPQLLLQLDHMGNSKRMFPINVRVDRTWLDVDEQGNTYFVKRTKSPAGPKDEYLTYAPDGALIRTVSNIRPFDQRKVIDGRVLAISDLGEIEQFDLNTGAATKLVAKTPQNPLPAYPARMARLASGRVALVESRSAIGHFLDPASGSIATTTFDAPEISAARATYAKPDSAVLITDVAADAANRLYLNLSGIRLAEGAIVLQSDASGRIIRSFRCALPRSPNHVVPGNPLGYMAPGLIGVHGSDLFIVDKKGKVARYTIPNS